MGRRQLCRSSVCLWGWPTTDGIRRLKGHDTDGASGSGHRHRSLAIDSTRPRMGVFSAEVQSERTMRGVVLAGNIAGTWKSRDWRIRQVAWLMTKCARKGRMASVSGEKCQSLDRSLEDLLGCLQGTAVRVGGKLLVCSEKQFARDAWLVARACVAPPRHLHDPGPPQRQWLAPPTVEGTNSSANGGQISIKKRLFPQYLEAFAPATNSLGS